MSGNTELLKFAADFIEKYCDQTTGCKECKLGNMCDVLDRDALNRSLDPPIAVHERIRKAAEE